MGAHVEYNDIVNAITQLNDRDILFIDEIHSLNSKIIIKMYSLLADAELHYTLQGQPLVLQVPKITIIGATTHSGKLPEALRNRFPTTFNLKEYTENDLKSMLDLYAKEFAYESIAIKERIVTMSRNVPRTLKNLVQNIRVYATCMKTNTITNTIVDRVSAALSIDNLGLTDVDIALLKALSQTRPKSLKTLSNILNVEVINIERIYEPYLLKLGFIEIVTKGRLLTEKGAAYIKTPGE
jgi:Holliday junction DNA helicase RuvB